MKAIPAKQEREAASWIRTKQEQLPEYELELCKSDEEKKFWAFETTPVSLK